MSDVQPPRGDGSVAGQDRRTGLDLDAIEARATAASDGPWIVVHEPAWEADDVQHPDVIKVGAPLYVGDDEPVTICLVSADYEDDPVAVLGDAEFIAHARTDVPALAKRLRAVLTLCEQRIAEHADYVRRIQDGTLITLDRFIGPAQVNVDDVLAALDVRHDPSATTEGAS